MARPKTLRASQTVIIRIENTLYDKMRLMAREMFGDNVSALIRKASEDFINKNK